jgi:hypothetical protein
MSCWLPATRGTARVLLACALLLGAGASCQAGRERSSAPAARKFEYPTFALMLDERWTCSDVPYGGSFHGTWAWGGAGVRCHRPDGQFVDVLIDVGMGQADADGHWLVRPLADGRVEVVRSALCVNSPPDPSIMLPLPACKRGDGRLDIFMAFEAGGHMFILNAGSVREESEQALADVHQVVSSFRYKQRKP